MRRGRRWTLGGAATITALLALIGTGAMAAAATLAIATHAPVTDVSGATTRASIVVGPHARAVYTLSGDSARHPKCTSGNGCLSAWPPVTVGSTHGLRLAHGIRGRLSVWRHGALHQLMLNGHPLYTYIGDGGAREANGEGIVSFGGTWHVLTPSGRTLTFGGPAPSTGGW